MDVFSEALQQGIAPAIVVAIYLIITKIIDSRKDAAQIEISSELTKSINIISDYIVSVNKTIVSRDRDKCKVAIEDAMYSSGMRLINFVASTLINNHIDINKDTVLINIHNIVNSEFYNVHGNLSLYKIDDRIPSEYLDKAWMDVVEKDIINVLYHSDALSNEQRIMSFANKLNLKFQSYITFITNHTIK